MNHWRGRMNFHTSGVFVGLYSIHNNRQEYVSVQIIIIILDSINKDDIIPLRMQYIRSAGVSRDRAIGIDVQAFLNTPSRSTINELFSVQ